MSATETVRESGNTKDDVSPRGSRDTTAKDESATATSLASASEEVTSESDGHEEEEIGDIAKEQEVTSEQGQTAPAEKAEEPREVKVKLDLRELRSGDASCKQEQPSAQLGEQRPPRERSPCRLPGGRRSPVVTSERPPPCREVPGLQPDLGSAEEVVAGGDVHTEHALKAAPATTCFSHLAAEVDAKVTLGTSQHLALDQCAGAVSGSDSCLVEVRAVASPPHTGSAERFSDDCRRRAKPKASDAH